MIEARVDALATHGESPSELEWLRESQSIAEMAKWCDELTSEGVRLPYHTKGVKASKTSLERG